MSEKQPNDKRNHRSGKTTHEKDGRKRVEQIHEVEDIATGERRRIDEDTLREEEMSPKDGGRNLRDLTDEERHRIIKRSRHEADREEES